jgi:REP element-mobilizing transposase RayT
MQYIDATSRSQAPLGNASREAPLRVNAGNARDDPHTIPYLGAVTAPLLDCTVVGWLPVFTRPDAVQIVLDSWKFLEVQSRLRLYGYVIQENHLHFVASAADLSSELKAFKSFTARRIIDLLEQNRALVLLDQLEFHRLRHKTESRYQVWQEGSHPQLIQDEEMLRQKLEYMHNNPVKRGYVDDVTHWRYSSARNYAGLAGLIEVNRDW